MNSKERVLTAFACGIPDRVPINYLANPGIDGRLKAHFGLAVDDHEGLRQALGVDFRAVAAAWQDQRHHRTLEQNDLYRRMQLQNGAIRGGIEASAHPAINATSWTDDLAVFAYEPDRFSSYTYAGAAAEMSVALRPYDGSRAAELLDSALAAMAWAESEGAEANPAGDSSGAAPERAVQLIADQRNVAAAALLLATGDSEWHELFLRTAAFLDDSPDDDTWAFRARYVEIPGIEVRTMTGRIRGGQRINFDVPSETDPEFGPGYWMAISGLSSPSKLPTAAQPSGTAGLFQRISPMPVAAFHL